MNVIRESHSLYVILEAGAVEYIDCISAEW